MELHWVCLGGDLVGAPCPLDLSGVTSELIFHVPISTDNRRLGLGWKRRCQLLTTETPGSELVVLFRTIGSSAMTGLD